MPNWFKISLTCLLIGLLAIFCALRWLILPNIDSQRNPVTPHSPYKISETAKHLHAQLHIADLHSDSLLWARKFEKRHDYGHMDLPRMREGNIKVQVLSAVTKSPRGLNFIQNTADAPDDITALAMAQLWPPRTWTSLYERAAYQAQRGQKIADDPDHHIIFIKTRSDLKKVLSSDQLIGFIMETEGAHPLEGDLDNLERLYDEGYRMMGLHHFFDNKLGGSQHGISKSGLTEFGKDVVRAIEKQGMIIDVAHSSPASVRDVLAITDTPLLLSHGGIVSACPSTHNRNLPDELLVDIAQRGGLIGIGFFNGVICDISPKGIAHAIKAAINLLGEDHVALGSDFDGAVGTSLEVSEISAITQALIDANIDERTIRKVMGENAINFFLTHLPQD